MTPKLMCTDCMKYNVCYLRASIFKIASDMKVMVQREPWTEESMSRIEGMLLDNYGIASMCPCFKQG